MALERNERKSAARPQNVLLDRGLEMVAVSGNEPARIIGSLNKFRRNRIARQPKLHRIVVDGVGRTDNFSARISQRVLVGADELQGCPRAGLIITTQNVPDERSFAVNPDMMKRQWLMHPSHSESAAITIPDPSRSSSSMR